MSNTVKIVLAAVIGLVLLGVFTEDFQQGPQSARDQGYGADDPRCPPDLAPPVGASAQTLTMPTGEMDARHGTEADS